MRLSHHELCKGFAHLAQFQKETGPCIMPSIFRIPLLLISFVVFSSAATLAMAGDCCCSHCGCKQVKKVTRLVTTQEEIEVPIYRCTTAQSFRPKKGVVCHSGYRCRKFYNLHSKWCCQEHCVCHEHCEDVTHFVDKNPCDSECECHMEHHHEKHYDYDITHRYRHCMSCQVEQGYMTSYGSRPDGCTKRVCTKQPTGEVCTSVVPVVRWVTFHACPQCAKRWSSDSR